MRTPLLSVLLAACGSTNPFVEVERQGVADYLGEAVVAEESTDGDVRTWRFDPASGPTCLHGDDFTVSARDGSSDTLFLFLQGGGACWSQFCLAIETAPPGIPEDFEILDPNLPANPLADADLVYVPYCDGSLFAGDTTSGDRTYHGLRNLSAALDVARARYPDPERIVLAGSSGGGFGTIMATVVLRSVWPETPLDVVDDAGVGVAMGDYDPGFVTQLMEEWNAQRFLPASCPGCVDNGHLTEVVAWELERDPNLRISAFSSYGDTVITDIFLGIGREGFEPALIAETDSLHARYPDRYAAFLDEGTHHTTLLGDIRGFLGTDVDPSAFEGLVEIGSLETSEVDGVTFSEWMGWFLDGDDRWGPLAD